MARPPTSPISTTSARYPVHRSPHVHRNRYQATRMTSALDIARSMHDRGKSATSSQPARRGVCLPPPDSREAAHWRPIPTYGRTSGMGRDAAATGRNIDVFLADDNLIVREGVRALIERNADLRVVGVAADYDGVVTGCAQTEPQVLVTDVRMPPSFRREGIDAAKEVRKRHPGTGVVVLSQYDDPEYAVSLLAEGSAGYGYLLKDRVAEGNQLADAIRSVATGGTALDPAIVEALVRPVIAPGELAPAEEELLGMIAEGKPIKAIAVARQVPPEAVDAEVEAVFVKLAAGVASGNPAALNRLRMLHQAIID